MATGSAKVERARSPILTITNGESLTRLKRLRSENAYLCQRIIRDASIVITEICGWHARRPASVPSPAYVGFDIGQSQDSRVHSGPADRFCKRITTQSMTWRRQNYVDRGRAAQLTASLL
ncbi:hypothetical protein EVAR_88081_1 [Eumeta japonica]|uniref:Uncharacterized protein n=1 Tax=Eumeta variegata TaxID=151549 RepID=A0A4C1WFN2_EUMVA|nr:hypothetical protein EVAR_88081_1 [Eumeta japonica]